MAWTDEEAIKLISLWGEDEIQVQLEGCRRNKDVFEKIAREMAAAGYYRSAVQCREKVKKLKAEYKRIRDSNNETGRNRRSSRFYEKLDEILGHRPATQPEFVLDSQMTSKDSPSVFEVEQTAVSDCEETQIQDSPDVQPTESDCSGSSKERRSLRKRPKKTELLGKAMDEVVTKIAKLQEESDSKFYDMEMKRMQLEERRWREDREREERQRSEERDFQLNVFRILAGQPVFPTPQNPGLYSGGRHSSQQWSADDQNAQLSYDMY